LSSLCAPQPRLFDACTFAVYLGFKNY
jgi:hypothetical protein